MQPTRSSHLFWCINVCNIRADSSFSRQHTFILSAYKPSVAKNVMRFINVMQLSTSLGHCVFLLWRATNLRGSITVNCLLQLASCLKKWRKKAVSKVVLNSTKASYMHLTVFHAIEVLLIVSSISTAFSADWCERSVMLQRAQVLGNIFIL